MPIFLLLIGAMLMVVAIRGNTTYLVNLVKSDVLGANGFIMWILAIIVLVTIGYVKQLKPISDAFLGLVILVIIVYAYKNNENIFQTFVTQVKDGVSTNGNCGVEAQGSTSSGGGIFGGGLIGNALNAGFSAAQKAGEAAVIGG